MASWCNCRLIVFGRRRFVLDFSKSEPPRGSSTVWGPYLKGEGGDLIADRMASVRPGWARKAYGFQVRSDDAKEHFRRMSRQHPELCFVIVYGCPNNADYGSYLIRNGHSKSHRLPAKLEMEVMRKHGVRDDGGDDDAEDWRFWAASFELMDLAEAHWKQAALQAIGAPLKKSSA